MLIIGNAHRTSGRIGGYRRIDTALEGICNAEWFRRRVETRMLPCTSNSVAKTRHPKPYPERHVPPTLPDESELAVAGCFDLGILGPVSNSRLLPSPNGSIIASRNKEVT